MLDERVSVLRADTYDPRRDLSPSDFDAWAGHHRRYLSTFVNRTLAFAPPKRLDPRRPHLYAQTFSDLSTRRHEALDSGTLLIRVEDIGRMRFTTRVPSDFVVTTFRDASAGEAVAQNRLAGLLRQWIRDARPAFVTFFSDVEDLVPDDPSLAPSGWGNALRDRLGLAPYKPSERASRVIDIAVFRYPLAKVPKMVGTRGSVLVHMPTVLDGGLLPSFCPSPGKLDSGYAVDLSDAEVTIPARELLHPPLHEVSVGELWRVGQVSIDPAQRLDRSRGWHLLCLRELADDEPYAEQTDGDIT